MDNETVVALLALAKRNIRAAARMQRATKRADKAKEEMMVETRYIVDIVNNGADDATLAHDAIQNAAVRLVYHRAAHFRSAARAIGASSETIDTFDKMANMLDRPGLTYGKLTRLAHDAETDERSPYINDDSKIALKALASAARVVARFH